MATTQTSYFTNAIVGQPMVGADYDIYEDHSTPRYAVGTGFIRGDGNRYRYCHFGAAVDWGAVVATDNSESTETYTNVCIAPATAGAEAGSTNINKGAIGSHYIRGNFTFSNNQMAGGYAVIVSGAGAGFTYRIKGNPSTSGASAIDVQLEEPLVEAVSTDTDIMFIGNSYANLEDSTSSTDWRAVGVVTRGHSAASYGWICTRGVIGVEINANVTGGNFLLAAGTAGTVDTPAASIPNVAWGSEILSPIGQALETVVSSVTVAPAFVKFE